MFTLAVVKISVRSYTVRESGSAAGWVIPVDAGSPPKFLQVVAGARIIFQTNILSNNFFYCHVELSGNISKWILQYLIELATRKARSTTWNTLL